MTRGAFLFLALPAILLFITYFPALKYLSRAVASPYAKADIRKRVAAAATDASIVATSILLYQRLQSPALLAFGAVYLLVRDGAGGQSLGKLLFGLVVMSVETRRPATLGHSVRRNMLFVLPGANVAALFLEAMTLVRDEQGQRLGDRLAQTQVVEGYGAKDLARSLTEWWRETLELARARRGRRSRERRPA